MSKSIKVPYLSKKLDLLLRFDNVLTTRKELAGEMKIRQEQISRWQSVTDTTAPDTIPLHHFKRLLEIFNVSEQWMTSDLEYPAEPLDRFTSRLASVLRSRTARSAWQNLFLEAEVSELLSVRRLSAEFRALIPEDQSDEFMGDRFVIDEKVYIELKVDTPWQPSDKATLAFLTLIIIDGSQITCLCPSARSNFPSHEVINSRITVPSVPSKRALVVTAPIGIQSVIAILTRESLPDTLCNELMRPDHPDLRDCLVRISQELQIRPRDSWYCLKQHYYVEQRSESDDTEQKST